MNHTLTSVIIATRNRSGALSRLLEGLTCQQDAPPFEVIIGDNGSTDDTAAVIERARGFMPVNRIWEERPGKSRALNAALKHVHSPLVVFTDDDVVPTPRWLAELHTASEQYKGCRIFGGRIDVDPTTVPRWVRRSYNLMSLLTSAHNLGDSNRPYGYGEYPFGPNMAIRKHLLLEKTAPYPELMGPGTSMPTGDESGFLMQFSPPGRVDRLYVPAACVIHDVEPENVAFKTALIRCFQAGRAIGSLGLPPVAKLNPKTVSISRVTIDRLRSCGSPQELACITVRFLGYIRGRYQMRSANNAKPNPPR
ncbi:MAG: glycosyltransferase family 2 protein [Desulfobacterales bacterium]